MVFIMNISFRYKIKCCVKSNEYNFWYLSFLYHSIFCYEGCLYIACLQTLFKLYVHVLLFFLAWSSCVIQCCTLITAVFNCHSDDISEIFPYNYITCCVYAVRPIEFIQPAVDFTQLFVWLVHISYLYRKWLINLLWNRL